MEKKYRINDIFYSLQGEGHNTGRAATFIRFSGCNLCCSFCDTDFSAFEEMTSDEIIGRIERYPARLVVLTGGEPTLQADAPLVDRLHAAGYEVAMESNGTCLPPEGIDWLTVSPKTRPRVTRCNELKCIYDATAEPETYGVKADYYYLQPEDTGNAERNAAIVEACIDYIKAHPQWILSLQTHKLVGFK